MKYLRNVHVADRKVLLRLDLTDSSKNGTADDFRLKQIAPSVQAIVKAGGIPVILAHSGDPQGKDTPQSLRPVISRLRELCSCDLRFIPDSIGPEMEPTIHGLELGQGAVLENLLFNPGERNNAPEFAAQLARLGDVYINDAFSVSFHRWSSIVELPKLFGERAAGPLVEREIESYNQALEKPRRPLCVILGGGKISAKLNALVHLASKADKLIIGGALANTFLAAQGIQMGRSVYEPDLIGKALELLGMLARRECKVYLPVDLIVSPSQHAKGLGRAVPAQEIPADTMALDIGPATSLLYKEAIHNAETIVWNGPMGIFENEEFSKGTTDLVEAAASAHGYKTVGGNDTLSAIQSMQLGHRFDHLSSGGDAYLCLLEGTIAPGLAVLKE